MPAGLLPLVNAACKDYLALNGVILLCYVCYVCTDVNITSARRVHWSSTSSRHAVLSVASKPVAFLIQPKVHTCWSLKERPSIHPFIHSFLAIRRAHYVENVESEALLVVISLGNLLFCLKCVKTGVMQFVCVHCIPKSKSLTFDNNFKQMWTDFSKNFCQLILENILYVQGGSKNRTVFEISWSKFWSTPGLSEARTH